MKSHYDQIEKAIVFINQNLRNQPNLEDIASEIGISPFHFQRLFREWAGISPKRFLQYVTVSHAKKLLEENSIIDTSLEIGLSSQSRLYDHFVSIESVTPGEYKSKGYKMIIEYGLSDSPFGKVFIAANERGICHIAFLDAEKIDIEMANLQKVWINAEYKQNQEKINTLCQRIFNLKTQKNQKFHLYVQGSNFQIKIWESLLRIPYGKVCSYQQVAHTINAPNACRAVAKAIAKNPIGYLIPCHRVIRKSGAMGGYRWNCSRKQTIQAWETAHTLINHNQGEHHEI